MKPKFGSEHNVLRQRLGLPELPAEWDSHTTGPGLTVWYNPLIGELQRARQPHHASKQVYSPGEIIAFEIDTYYGPRRYETLDGTLPETLTLEYRYRGIPERGDARGAPGGWRCRIADARHDPSESITLEQADSILSNWNLERTSSFL
jgi:hypothetical protein